uniref:Uncharacterized protein n=1 Tax=Triticum urartu TaxID=4572 RepID=A0A8R7V7A3_TRIUA
MIFKLDFRKAFNSIAWETPPTTLNPHGLPTQMGC